MSGPLDDTAPEDSAGVDPPAWVRDAIFYEIFPDRFARSARVGAPGPFEDWDAPPSRHGFKGGNLLGIAERLPYLADLGITALYLTPIFSSGANHRYHTYDYLTVDPILGGNAALRELVDAVHANDMRIVLDGVFNHTGRGFWAFHHIVENGAESPYRDWFHVDLERLSAGRPLLAYPEALPPGVSFDGRWAGEDRSPGASSIRRLGYRAWWDLPALPKLNTSNPAVREHLLGVAEHWVRFGIDGWRLDVPTEIDDAPFWQAFRRRCRAVNPECYLVGEIWHAAPEWLAGDRFDALMNYPLGQAILAYAAGDRMDRATLDFHHEYRNLEPLDGAGFAGAVEQLDGIYGPALTDVQLNLIGSHDTPRFVTLAGGNVDALRLATLLQMTLPGAPCIYYGDEVGLEGGHDPDNRRAFPWAESRWDTGLLAFFRAVIRVRRSTPALRGGTFRRLVSRDGALAFLRSAAGSACLVGVNVDDAEHSLIVGDRSVRGRPWRPVPLPGWEHPHADARSAAAPSADPVVLVLAPRSARVLVADG
ncbi:MAG TPA: glycoside hydrolase family 13 protein [Candidatus Limnocylindrales bacterium]